MTLQHGAGIHSRPILRGHTGPARSPVLLSSQKKIQYWSRFRNRLFHQTAETDDTGGCMRPNKSSKHMEKSSGKELSESPPVPRAFSKGIPAMGLFPVPQSKTSKNTKPKKANPSGYRRSKPMQTSVELRGGEYCKIFSNAGADNVVRVKRLPSSRLAFLLSGKVQRSGIPPRFK